MLDKNTLTNVRQKTKNKKTLITTITFIALVFSLITPVALSSPSYVYISDISYTDQEITTGEKTTITPTIYNSGDKGIQITELTITNEDLEIIDEFSNLGTLGSGDSIDVPLKLKLNSPGKKEFTLHIRGTEHGDGGDIDGIYHVKYPIHLVVNEPSSPEPEVKPNINIKASDMVEGVEKNVKVTVSNGDSDSISNLVLTLEASNGKIIQKKRFHPRLDGWNKTTYNFQVNPTNQGRLTLKSTLKHDGAKITTQKSVFVEPLKENIDIHASFDSENKEIIYSVVNNGNAPLRNIVVSGKSQNTDLPSITLDRIDPYSLKKINTSTSDLPETNTVNITASYETGYKTGNFDKQISLINKENQDKNISNNNILNIGDLVGSILRFVGL